jgi:hypothetical protein
MRRIPLPLFSQGSTIATSFRPSPSRSIRPGNRTTPSGAFTTEDPVTNIGGEIRTTTATTTISASAWPSNTQACNSYPEFCTRKYSPFTRENNVAWNQKHPVTQQPDDRCHDSGISVLFLSSGGGAQISGRYGLGSWHFRAFKSAASIAVSHYQLFICFLLQAVSREGCRLEYLDFSANTAQNCALSKAFQLSIALKAFSISSRLKSNIVAVNADEQKYAEDIQAFLLTRLFSRPDMPRLGIS